MCARQLSFNFSSMVWGGHGPVAPPSWIRPWVQYFERGWRIWSLGQAINMFGGGREPS